MRTVSLERLLKDSQFLISGKRELPGDQDYAAFLGHLDHALAEGWRAEWWPDLMTIEKRYFRPVYSPSLTPFFGSETEGFGSLEEVFGQDGSTISAGGEYYWPLTKSYYLTLRDFEASSPTTDPTDEDGELNTAYWIECSPNFSGDFWEDDETYAVGDIVEYSRTGLCYAVHTLPPVGTAPTETAYWGMLTNFDRTLDFDQEDQTAIGDIRGLYSAHPLRSTDYEGIDHLTMDNKAWVRDAWAHVYVDFRRRRPDLTGDDYNAASAYSEGDQVYWDNDGAIEGNLYRANDEVAAGETPTSTPDVWDVVEIPKFLQAYLAWSAASKFLVGDGADERKAMFEATAEGYLQLEADNVYRQQSQVPAISPRTY